MGLLVTDGEQRSTLAVVRAVGKAGVPVTVGSSSGTSLAGVSRFAKRTFTYPPPEKDPEGFLTALIREARETGSAVLFPMTDVALQIASANRSRLDPLLTLPLADHASVLALQDKGFILEKSKELGIACPTTYDVASIESLDTLSRQISYPAILKPRFSHYGPEGLWISGLVRFVSGPDDLIRQYRAIHEKIPEPLVQEVVPGEGRGVFLLLWDGEIKAAFCHRRLREKPPWGGVSVYSESLPLDEGLVERSAALLRACGSQGVGMVEYKLDRRDGLHKIMEVNGRFWGSLQLAIDSGINFPLLLYRLASGENIPPQLNYRAGVRCRWLLGDLDHLLIRLIQSDKVRERLPNYPSSLRTCVDFLKLYESNLHYDVFRLDDPKPGLVQISAYVEESLRALRRRLGWVGPTSPGSGEGHPGSFGSQ